MPLAAVPRAAGNAAITAWVQRQQRHRAAGLGQVGDGRRRDAAAVPVGPNRPGRWRRRLADGRGCVHGCLGRLRWSAGGARRGRARPRRRCRQPILSPIFSASRRAFTKSAPASPAVAATTARSPRPRSRSRFTTSRPGSARAAASPKTVPGSRCSRSSTAHRRSWSGTSRKPVETLRISTQPDPRCGPVTPAVVAPHGPAHTTRLSCRNASHLGESASGFARNRMCRSDFRSNWHLYL